MCTILGISFGRYQKRSQPRLEYREHLKAMHRINTFHSNGSNRVHADKEAQTTANMLLVPPNQERRRLSMFYTHPNVNQILQVCKGWFTRTINCPIGRPTRRRVVLQCKNRSCKHRSQLVVRIMSLKLGLGQIPTTVGRHFEFVANLRSPQPTSSRDLSSKVNPGLARVQKSHL